MPQLDFATFASQLFWLMLFFWSFYFIIVKYILPTISEILKVRQKKLRKSQAIINISASEQQELVADTDKIFQQAFAQSSQLLVTLVSDSATWLVTTNTRLNHTTFLQLNKKYLNTIASLAAKRSEMLALLK